MQIKFFDTLTADAASIRTEVFVNEQGFKNEFGGEDNIATHAVLYAGKKPVATCRFFEENGCRFVLGRIAVIKEFRGQGLGAEILRLAEKEIRLRGGREIYLHAQTRVKDFYAKLGYTPCGKPDFDEGCPHTPMHKLLT